MLPQSRNLAFVFEGLNLFPTYTVYDNIAFALRSPVYFELSDSATNQLDLNRPTFLLGFWLEDIKISLSPVDGYIKSQLYGQEYRGTDRIISLAVGDETLIKMVGAEFEGRYGDDCWFSYDTEKIFLFDPSTGLRL